MDGGRLLRFRGNRANRVRAHEGRVCAQRKTGRTRLVLFVIAGATALTFALTPASTYALTSLEHFMNWDSDIVANSSGATMAQGVSVPCAECHNMTPGNGGSIHFLSGKRCGSPVLTVRQLCEGCHQPFDSGAAPVVVCGLILHKLPNGVVEHGSASDIPCSNCHGLSGHAPVRHGTTGDCGASGCHGTSGSHAAHLNASDPKGPGALACGDCHNTAAYPAFATGTDSDLSGLIELDETTVCNACHSPGGSYNGVDSTAGSIGAKDYWAARVYETAADLKAGNELWCAGCHDGNPASPGNEPSLISGVYAPPVIGDKNGSYIYGTGWGFYETGHGLDASEPYPASGLSLGAGLGCDACHSSAERHIDGARRTFTSAGTPTDYRRGYRLNLVGGEEPLTVPWPGNVNSSANTSRLCFSCHDSGPYLNPADHRSNFWNAAILPPGDNLHNYHLGFFNQMRWAPDWRSTMNSRIACVTCHNVHGSTQLAMIRDGELISNDVSRRPGLKMWYWNSAITVVNESNTDPPAPEGVPLAASNGWVWRAGTSGNLCTHCHGNNNTVRVARAPWQDVAVAPLLRWTDSPGYVTDGVDPDLAGAGVSSAFRVTYVDANNNPPSQIEVWIDANDNGSYEAGEKHALTADNPADLNYLDGAVYSTTRTLSKASDNVVNYRFFAQDATGVASGPPAVGASVTIGNSVPVLAWTGETGYVGDGVNPNSASTGSSFAFRVRYTDADNELPTAISVRIDVDDSGSIEASETFAMTQTDPADTDATPGGNGKLYAYSRNLTRRGDGVLAYSFAASDGIAAATGSPVSGGTLTVTLITNTAPTLAWTGESGYAADGANPDLQAGNKPFFFRILYTDIDNDAPGLAQVWIDLNDDGDKLDPGEKRTMSRLAVPPNDEDYANGEIYTVVVYIPYAGDGTLPYEFHFEDSKAAEALGVNGVSRTIEVFNALDVPSEYATIQAAVTAASTGNTVLVADGTYAGFAFNNKDITVESVNGPGSTIIDGGGGGILVNFNYHSGNSSNSTFSGFTVRNGAIGIQANMSIPVITNCIVENNTTYGIDHWSQASWPLTVDGCTIRNNTGPGLNILNNTARATVTDTTFSGNSATTGGGVNAAGGSDLRFERCVFSNNSASNYGGGFGISGGTVTLAVTDSSFTGNTAGTDGGALYFMSSSSTNATLSRTVFAGNSAARGGALRTGQGTYNFTNLTMTGNYASGQGGAAIADYGWLTYDFCTIAGNSADTGGGLYLNANTNGWPKVLNSIVWGNDSRANTTLEAIDSSQINRVEVRYTDLDQAFAGFYNQVGNMTANPLFVDSRTSALAPTANGDYHLRASSPLEGRADAGATLALDRDVETRPMGSGRDMGADEIGFAAPAMIVQIPETFGGAASGTDIGALEVNESPLPSASPTGRVSRASLPVRKHSTTPALPVAMGALSFVALIGRFWSWIPR